MVSVNNTTKQKINSKQIVNLTEKFLRTYKLSNQEISIAIVGDKKMKTLNRIYRQINKTTDVLSFSGSRQGCFLGEVIININEMQRIRKYALMLNEINVKLSPRAQKKYLFNFILVHGLLHLAGYNDQTATSRHKMLELGRDFCAII